MGTKIALVLLSVFLVIALFGAGGVGYLYLQLDLKFQSLQNQYQNSQSQFQQSQNDLTATITQLNAARTSISQLESDKLKLTTDLTAAKVATVQANNKLNVFLCEDKSINMDYSDNSKIALRLQSFVSGLSFVKSVSYVIPERLYSNTLSQLYHVTYVDKSDGQVYSKRYIVYVTEFGWKQGVFSIDEQCWIDPPH
jgi:hypothetical protein